MLKRTSTLTAVLAVAAVLMSVLGCDVSIPTGTTSEGFERTYTEHLEQTLDGRGASLLDARTINGAITLEGSAQDRVIVQIRKEIRAFSKQEAEAFAQKVQVHVKRNGNEIQIYKEHPKPPNHIQVVVAYEIQSPSGVDVRLGTVNGRIRIRGMVGTVDAETINGAIDLVGGGSRVGLSTVNGDIDALVEPLGGEGRFFAVNGSVDVEVRSGVAPVTATTTNGSVELTLPGNFSGQLSARAARGRVRSEFPMSLPPGSPQNYLTGPLGKGGNTQVTLLTTNGNVALKRR